MKGFSYLNIKLADNTIDKDDIQQLITWLSEMPRLTKGELTWELEKKWANYLGTKHSVFVNSGSSAILLTLYALKVLDRLRNDKIVVPDLSWLTDVSSPMQIGLEPILCDCNMKDLSVNFDDLERIFKRYKPAAFILVHVLGLVPEMKRILDLCKKHDVILLEDTCESMGSKYQGKNLGTFSLASMFSTYFGHHISTIEGGFVNTNDQELYYTMLSLRSHGWDRDLPQKVQKKMRKKWGVDDFSAMYTFYYPGFNLRSTDLQAFIGLRQIDKLGGYTEARERNFRTYLENINRNILEIEYRKGDFISNFAYPVVHLKKKKIVKDLMTNGIECRPLIAGSMGKKPFWIKYMGEENSFKNTEMLNEYGFYLPNHHNLSTDYVKLICNIINAYKG